MAPLAATFFFFGLFHGVNPGMGWLLASALGFKRKKRSVILAALLALTLGHLLAVGAVVLTVGWLQWHLPRAWVAGATLAALTGVGIYHLYRQSHPSWFGMEVKPLTLVLWSACIATAHGAGLMLLPFILGDAAPPLMSCLSLILIHTAGYLTAAGAASFIFYETMGHALLKRAWINFDLIWACALLFTAGFLLYSLIEYAPPHSINH